MNKSNNRNEIDNIHPSMFWVFKLIFRIFIEKLSVIFAKKKQEIMSVYQAYLVIVLFLHVNNVTNDETDKKRSNSTPQKWVKIK